LITSFSASNETVFMLLSLASITFRDGFHIFEKLIEGILSIEVVADIAEVDDD